MVDLASLANRMKSHLPWLCLQLCMLTNQGISQDVEPHEVNQSQQLAFFEQKIQPILAAKCYQCHSAQAAEVEGGLRLDTRDTIRGGGDSGPAVIAGDADNSLLLARILSADEPMPPDERLSAKVVADIRQWILDGAADPREVPSVVDPDYSEARQYWAFQPVVIPQLPTVEQPAWPRDPIDLFILAKLEQHQLSPAPAAAPNTLMRRLYFDLIGLPPTPQQVDEFVRNPTDDHYQRIVDRLLESPQYGERWAQHWLDVVRYAETEGFEYDRTLPDVWRYRDYVIESLNCDKPFDLFVTEQLAGDEIRPGDAEMRIAAGLHRLGAVRRNAGNQMVASSRDEVLTERTDIVGSVFLGLTIGCARCHDHKFDPIPQQDYYRMKAFFAASLEDNISLLDEAESERRRLLKEDIEQQITELKKILPELDGDDERQVRDEIEQLEQQLPPSGPMICSITNDTDHVWAIQVLRRGDPNLGGPEVGMRNLGVLGGDARPELPLDTPNPRSQLARSLTDPTHPLTSRVIVNRLWQQHFGTGLVSTANDFGRNGSPPSHPELLDFLAAQLVAKGWHLKALHRQIVLSSTYRQSSQAHGAQRAFNIDADNRLLWRYPRRRLSGEEIRDAMLAVSGKLNPQMGGPSVALPVEQELIDQLYKPTQWAVASDPQEHFRRSIYLFAKRNLRLPFMEVFDQPSAQTSCAARVQSTHARQALELLNGPMTNTMAEAFADRLVVDVGRQPAALVGRAYELVASREPNQREARLAQRFIQEVGLKEFALAMFNINPFLYVD